MTAADLPADPAGPRAQVAQEEFDPRRPGRTQDELIMDLERDQLVAETSLPLPPARLGRFTKAGLWALRVFVVLVSAMVIYAFVAQLR